MSHSTYYPRGDKGSVLTYTCTYSHNKNTKEDQSGHLPFTRLTAHFMYGLVTDLLICELTEYDLYMMLNVLIKNS